MSQYNDGEIKEKSRMRNMLYTVMDLGIVVWWGVKKTGLVQYR